MGLFSNIRRALRGGKALPNEHGPAFAIEAARRAMEEAHAGVMGGTGSAGKCPVIHDTSEVGSNPSPEIKFVPVSTGGTNAGCACSGTGGCKCSSAKTPETKVKKVAAKPAASTKKPAASTTTTKPAATAAKKPAPKKK